jgi:hypothetical protein
MSEGISPVVAAALDRVVSDNGWLSASRPGALKAGLSDVLGSEAEQHRAELDALVVSAEEGVPAELRTAGHAAAQGLVPDLVQRLVGWGMTDDMASSVVGAWATLVPELSSSAPVVDDQHTVTSEPREPVAPAPPSAAAAAAGAAEPAHALTAAPPPPVKPTAPTRARRAYVAVAGAIAVVLVIAAAAWLGLHRGSNNTSNPLLTSLASANAGYAKGLIPPKSCTGEPDHVECTNPNPAVTRLTVTTYANKTALYAAYVAAAEKLRGAPLQQNTGNCNTRESSGERSWNHNFQHPLQYSVQDHISEDLTMDDKAEGRMACEVSGNFMTIIWTADASDLLGVVEGPPMSSSLFLAWKHIHHAISMGGMG